MTLGIAQGSSHHAHVALPPGDAAPLKLRLTQRAHVPPCSKLERNQLTGTLPPEWGLAREGIMHLSMDRNQLEGPIPSSWADIDFEEL